MSSSEVVDLLAVARRVIDAVTVDVPRPRTLETMAAPRFNEISTYLRGVFRNLPGPARP